jgi:hypothetical protein
MEEQRAIDRVTILYNSDSTMEDSIDDTNINFVPEIVGFGWNSEEEEKEFLLEEFGPEWVEENWKPWAVREKELETE